MTNPIHLLSVAALLLVAFLVGAVVGTSLRLIALRLTRKPAAVVSAPVEAAPVGPPLVTTPVIAPLPLAPTPAAPSPAEIPVPDFAATLAASTPEPTPPVVAPVPDFAATVIALAGEAPPPAFIEATKARAEPAGTLQPLPEVRAIPAMAPLPVIDVPKAPVMQPAHVAGETTSGLQVAAPLHENPPTPVAVEMEPGESRTAEVIPFPTVVLEQPADQPTDILVGGEAVAVVDTSGLVVAEAPAEPEPVTEPVVVELAPATGSTPIVPAEDDFIIVGEEAFAVPEAAVVPAAAPDQAADTIPVPIISAGAAVAAVVTAALPMPEVVEVSMAVDAPASLAPQPVEAVAEPAASAPAAAPVVSSVELEPIVVSLDEPMDEDAAMRAIEGNWTPRRPPARTPRPAAPPEGVNQAVAASARAVTAARRTAEAVIAEVAEVKAEARIEAGRPAGLDGPRDGRKDDLTHIIGVLPVIETALNKLGVYHFDQVGALSDENIAWIEGHLGVPGRIGRELWREQARELSAVLKPRRTAEKK